MGPRFIYYFVTSFIAHLRPTTRYKVLYYIVEKGEIFKFIQSLANHILLWKEFEFQKH